MLRVTCFIAFTVNIYILYLVPSPLKAAGITSALATCSLLVPAQRPWVIMVMASLATFAVIAKRSFRKIPITY
jgi:hypothetical protein